MNLDVIDGVEIVEAGDRLATSLAVYDEPRMIRPLGTPTEIIEAWQLFQKLKEEILTFDDIQEISGRRFIKKSGWRKIAAAFGISVEITYECLRVLAGGGVCWDFRAKAIAPNGRAVEAAGSCASTERKFSHVEADPRAQAQTRATNRAIADLVGGGEVSAEEMSHEDAGPSLEELFLSEICVTFDAAGVPFNRHSAKHLTRVAQIVKEHLAAKKGAPDGTREAAPVQPAD